MTMVYPTDTSHCALCERRVRSTRLLCFYVVGARAVIGRGDLIDQEAFVARGARQGGEQ